MAQLPTLRRWMLFVDGENFTIEGTKLAVERGLPLLEGPHFRSDEFIWLPHRRAVQMFYYSSMGLEFSAVRSHYYTSVCGDEVALNDTRGALWALGFTPIVIKKAKKQKKAKGVDIALTKDLLSHGFLDNYDVAVLIAGDADYVPVVEEVKRLGKRIVVAFFTNSSLGLELRLAADDFQDISDAFENAWRGK